MYKPNGAFIVPARILTASTTRVNGVSVKNYTEGGFFWCSAKSYGGTEKTINGVYMIADTVIIETYYRPDILAGDRIRLEDDGSTWEILNTPEDIERKHMWLKFKVERVHGGA